MAPTTTKAKKKRSSAAKTAAKSSKSTSKSSSKKAAGKKSSSKKVSVALFAELSLGEKIDAERTLLSSPELQAMAKVGRYRIICAEPWVAKPPHPAAGKRLARIVCYNYAEDCAVSATVDLEETEVLDLQKTKSQPMLAVSEEFRAVETAFADKRVSDQLALGDTAVATMHYWSARPKELASQRRSAAVLIGQVDGPIHLVAVVDLISDQVTDVELTENW